MKKAQKLLNLTEHLTDILDKNDIIKIDGKDYIDYNSYYKIYKYKYLIIYCDDHKIEHKSNEVIRNLISCEDLLFFIDKKIHQVDTIGGNKVTNTIGNVTIMFDSYFAIYKTKYIKKIIYLNGYKYNVVYTYKWYKNEINKKNDFGEVVKIDKNSYFPFARFGFMIAYLIRVNFNRYFLGYLFIDFEINLRDGTLKIYDVVISDKYGKILIIVEIQEKANHSVNSVNDNYKKAIVNSKGIRMEYVYQSLMDDVNYNYECDVLARLLNEGTNALIANSEEFRNSNLLSEFSILCHYQKKFLEEELCKINVEVDAQRYTIIEAEIEVWNSIIDDETNSMKQVKVLYKYKIEAANNPKKDIVSKYNIPLAIVIDNLRLDIDIDNISNKDEKSENQIHIEELIIKFSINNDVNFYFSFDSVIRFLIALKIESIDKLKMQFINVLLCTQAIYEKYIRIIETYKNLQIEQLSADCSKIKYDIECRLIKEHNRLINNRDEKIDILKKENKLKDNEIKKLQKENVEENFKDKYILSQEENKRLLEIIKKFESQNLDSDLENQSDESEIDI
jgi:hypothetical protein